MQISLNLCPNRDIYAFWDPFCWYLLDLALPFRIWKSRNNPGEVITILETHNAPIQVVRGLHTGEVITGLSDNTINLEGRHMRANLFCSYRYSERFGYNDCFRHTLRHMMLVMKYFHVYGLARSPWLG